MGNRKTSNKEIRMYEFHNFIITLNENDFMKFFKKILGPVKRVLIYNFLKINTDYKSFTELKIAGIGKKTKDKLWSFDFNSIKRLTPHVKSNVDELFRIIFPDHFEHNLKEIYKRVSDYLGGSDINIRTRQLYKKKDGSVLDFETARKNQEGSIRTYLEENSPDSRQHWVRANTLSINGVGKNLFSNEMLRERNQAIHWKIASDETKRILKNMPKSGLWAYKPSPSRPTDEEFIIMEQELVDRPKRFQCGTRNPISRRRAMVTTQSTSVFI